MSNACNCKTIKLNTENEKHLNNGHNFLLYTFKNWSLFIYEKETKHMVRSGKDVKEIKNTIKEDLICDHNNLFLTLDQVTDLFTIMNTLTDLATQKYLIKLGFTINEF